MGRGDFRGELRSEVKLLRCQYLVLIEVLVDFCVNCFFKDFADSRRSGENLARLQTGSHSVSQAITCTSSLTEHSDHQHHHIQYLIAVSFVAICRLSKRARMNKRQEREEKPPIKKHSLLGYL